MGTEKKGATPKSEAAKTAPARGDLGRTRNIRPGRLRVAVKAQMEHYGLKESDTIGALLQAIGETIIAEAENQG